MVPARNALFFDPEHALRCARERREVIGWGRVKVAQLCYYTGRMPLQATLDNLIFVPKSDFVSWLTTTRLRPPEEVVFPDPPPPRAVMKAFSDFFEQSVIQAKRRQQELFEGIQATLARLPPEPATGKLRIFAGSCIYTEVVQHSARGLLKAFAELGHEVLLSIESDEREFINLYHHIQLIERFRPHLVININHHKPGILAPWMVQMVWWQDPMDPVTSDRAIPWRRNDLVYTLFGMWFGERLIAKGLPAERLKVQHFCIDAENFLAAPAVPRQPRSVTFVGSSYIDDLLSFGAAAPPVADAMRQHLAEHGPIDLRTAMAIAARHGMTDEFTVVTIWYTLIRDEHIRLLCRIAPPRGWSVEIYGHGWEKDPVVQPYHRGVIRGRGKLAALYRRCERALSLQPFMVNHQRLAEIGCSGCIPVVYDCRRASDPPYWEDQCAYFADEAGLLAALEQPVTVDPRRFADHFAYRAFAQRILADAEPHLRGIAT